MKKLIMASITAVVVIVVLAGTLIPILDDATATQDTFTNEGYFRMTHYDDTTDHTLTWTYEDPSVVTVDNVDVPIDFTTSSGQTSIVIDTSFIVRFATNADGTPYGLLYFGNSGGSKVASVADSQTASFTFSSGTMTAVVGSNTGITSTYTDIYIPSLDGPFIMKDANVDAYVMGDSEIIAYGTTRINTANGLVSAPGVGLAFNGSIDDGATGFVWRGADSTTLSNIKVNGTEVSDHIDLYTFDSITATATYTETVDDETVTTDTAVTYNYVLVPYEVTAERSVHFTDGENAILGAIPVMVIVALLLGIVAMVIRSRMD